MTSSLSKEELKKTVDWLKQHPEVLPAEVHRVVSVVLAAFWGLLEKSHHALENLKLLRQMMGFTPKSEKGAQEKHDGAI